MSSQVHAAGHAQLTVREQFRPRTSSVGLQLQEKAGCISAVLMQGKQTINPEAAAASAEQYAGG